MKKKVFVGVSGGVDSSVTAYLLQQSGYDVTAVYMKNWSDDYGLIDECPWIEDMKYVEGVAKHLNIPFKVYNFEKEYRDMVIQNFYEEYQRGNTPNPDILCNKFIKFDYFLKKAQREGADLIATGHYAKTADGKLYTPADSSKDQTYFLAGVSEDQLEDVLFPLADLKKSEVRRLAKEADLPTANRKDSQGLCFVGQIELREFLSERLKPSEGEIVEVDSGKVVGTHNGVWYFTHGQRKGIGVGGAEEPYFVSGKDVESNKLYVAMGKSNPHLWSERIEVGDFHFINEDFREKEGLTAQIRYRAERVPVSLDGNVVNFSQKQWAPAPGQSVVFYKDNQCLGLAKIV